MGEEVEELVKRVRAAIASPSGGTVVQDGYKALESLRASLTRVEEERDARAEAMRSAVLASLPLMVKTQQNNWSDGFNAALHAVSKMVDSIEDHGLSRATSAEGKAS